MNAPAAAQRSWNAFWKWSIRETQAAHRQEKKPHSQPNTPPNMFAAAPRKRRRTNQPAATNTDPQTETISAAARRIEQTCPWALSRRIQNGELSFFTFTPKSMAAPGAAKTRRLWIDASQPIGDAAAEAFADASGGDNLPWIDSLTLTGGHCPQLKHLDGVITPQNLTVMHGTSIEETLEAMPGLADSVTDLGFDNNASAQQQFAKHLLGMFPNLERVRISHQTGDSTSTDRQMLDFTSTSRITHISYDNPNLPFTAAEKIAQTAADTNRTLQYLQLSTIVNDTSHNTIPLLPFFQASTDFYADIRKFYHLKPPSSGQLSKMAARVCGITKDSLLRVSGDILASARYSKLKNRNCHAIATCDYKWTRYENDTEGIRRRFLTSAGGVFMDGYYTLATFKKAATQR